ncbi:MAG TPA: class IV adenylate cyclase [Patescibacteria group bacterium]|nr:class IV adenylate cyclase [Patescibacteria group bacterium]
MEVEIKLVCRNLPALKKKLQGLGATLTKSKRQVDTYYDHPAKVLVKEKQYLRLRKSGDKKTLAHHQNLADGVNDECEMEMGKEARIEDFLERLRFPKLGVIDKTREQYKIGDFNVCLDSVKDIGDLVEIELEVEQGNEKEAKEKCWQMAKELGFTAVDEFKVFLCDIAVGLVKRPGK